MLFLRKIRMQKNEENSQKEHIWEFQDFQDLDAGIKGYYFPIELFSENVRWWIWNFMPEFKPNVTEKKMSLSIDMKKVESAFGINRIRNGCGLWWNI